MRILKNIYICFPEGKHKCLTMSYDDGKAFDRDLIEFFNQVGIKGTFHINGGLLEDSTYGERIGEREARTLYEGHEISAHTYSHPTIARCPITQVIGQVIEDRKILEDIAGYPVRGLSYPNGSYSKEIIDILPACGIEYARTVHSTGNFSMPSNFLEWNPTCHHNHSNFNQLADNFISLNKTQYLYLFYVWGHSYEFEGNDSWDNFREVCKKLSHRQDIWYATNMEIVDYLKAANNLKFFANGEKVLNLSSIPIWIEVDKKIVKIPSGETICLS